MKDTITLESVLNALASQVKQTRFATEESKAVLQAANTGDSRAALDSVKEQETLASVAVQSSNQVKKLLGSLTAIARFIAAMATATPPLPAKYKDRKVESTSPLTQGDGRAFVMVTRLAPDAKDLESAGLIILQQVESTSRQGNDIWRQSGVAVPRTKAAIGHMLDVLKEEYALAQ